MEVDKVTDMVADMADDKKNEVDVCSKTKVECVTKLSRQEKTTLVEEKLRQEALLSFSAQQLQQSCSC